MAQVAAAAGEAAKTATDRFVIDDRASRFTVRAFATGILSAMGHNPTIGIRDFSGEANFGPRRPAPDAAALAKCVGKLTIRVSLGLLLVPFWDAHRGLFLHRRALPGPAFSSPWQCRKYSEPDSDDPETGKGSVP